MNLRNLICLALGAAIPNSVVVAQSTSLVGTLTLPDAAITGVVVYLVPVGSPATTPAPPISAKVDQRDLRFVPRIITVPPGSDVVFSNSDPVMHNVFHPGQRQPSFDLGTYPQGEGRSLTFSHEGAYVILCHVHPEMVGYVVVVASRYRAVSDGEGRFRIDGLAPGTYRLRTWHRRLRTLERTVTIPASGVAHLDLRLSFGIPTEPRTVDQPSPP